MEAKQMFEELGYIEKQNDETFINYENTIGVMSTVSFNTKHKGYLVAEYNKTKELFETKAVTTALHKAITKQLKELGWLND